MGKLVIVESPAKTKTIGKILKSDYVVMASYGHVIDLAKKGGLNVDLHTFEGKYEVISEPRKKKVISELKKASKECDEIFLCADPDREGEAIAAGLVAILGIPKSKLRRATFNEITPKAVLAAISNPRDIDENLVGAQKARRFLDRIVGFKLSPLLWDKIFRGLSAGRVQSVALKILVEREREIEKFVAQEYWTITGNFVSEDKNLTAELKSVDGRKIVASAKDFEYQNRYHVKNEIDATHLATAILEQGKYKVSAFDQKTVSESAAPPFITSSLQQAAASLLGFDASRTMRTAQDLYEAGSITYMRTDSFRVSKDAQDAVREYVKCQFGDAYVPQSPNFFKSKKGAQDAHECIRPTDVHDTPNFGSHDQKTLYNLIWRKFVASQMSPATYLSSTCDLASGPYEFRATGRVKTFDGWTRVYRAEGEDSPLPTMDVGGELEAVSAKKVQHFTQPPPRYNDASLVKKLEAEGIGRPSTYASIIKTVLDRKYAERIGSGGRAPLMATELGKVVVDSLDGLFAIMDVQFTREMEEKLDKVEEGATDYKTLLSEFWASFEKELKSAKKAMKSTKEGKPTDFECPKCNSKLNERLSQYGRYFKCPNEGCGHTMQVGDDGKPQEKEGPKETGLKCDLCGSAMTYSEGRFGPYLACSKYRPKAKKGEDKGCPFTMNVTKKGPRRKFAPLPTDIDCKKCNKSKMVIRVGSRKKTLNAFLSCGTYPKCRNAEPLPADLQKQGEKAIAAFSALRSKDAQDLQAFQAFAENAGIQP